MGEESEETRVENSVHREGCGIWWARLVGT
jgi:hypothetical protein